MTVCLRCGKYPICISKGMQCLDKLDILLIEEVLSMYSLECFGEGCIVYLLNNTIHYDVITKSFENYKNILTDSHLQELIWRCRSYVVRSLCKEEIRRRKSCD